MAMSGIKIAEECDDANTRQSTKKDAQWNIYYIANLDKGGSKGGAKGSARCGSDDHPIVKCAGKRDRQFDAKKANDMVVDDRSDDGVITMKKRLWAEFVEELPENECRYAVLDYVCKGQSGAYNDKMKLVSWSPETCTTKQKMTYAATKDTLKKKFNINKEILLTSKERGDVDDAFDQLTE